MIRVLCLLLVAAALTQTSGCRRKRAENSVAAPAAPETAAPAVAPAAPTAPVAPPPAPMVTRPVSAPGVDIVADRIPTAPPNSSKSYPVDRVLTEALQRYNEANGKMPADFSVLVTQKYLKAMPSPPAGKRFALDRPHMQVVIVD